MDINSHKFGKWTTHNGTKNPFEIATLVEIEQRDGWREVAMSNEFNWRHRTDYAGNPWAGDIMSYRAKK